MPKRRVILILAVAMTCALLASMLVVWYVRKEEKRARALRMEVQPVVIATGDIPIGTRLTPSLVDKRDWPRAGVPQGAVSEPGAVLGRLVKVGIARDEPILEHRLFPKDLTGGAPGIMSVMVPQGKRAMAVGVNEVIGVSGFILPKDRVDVIATKTDEGTPKTTETIQNIEVLAVGKRLEQVDKQNIEVPTVTLAVTPEQAERLALALQEGKIHIAVRSILDNQVAGLATITRPSGMGRGRIAARSAGAGTRGGKGLVVDVIRGDKRALETHPFE